jgi:AAA family ATP:ADP antiporter
LTAHKALARFENAQILQVLTSISHEHGVPEELLMQLPALAETMDTQEAVDFLFGLVRHEDHVIQFKALESLHTIKEKHQHLMISSKQVMAVLVNEAEAYKQILSRLFAVQHPPRGHGADSRSMAARKEVVRLLGHQLDIVLKRIFWALGLMYPSGTIIPLLKDVRHEDQAVRINAVELLDNILEPNLKALLIPILESVIQEEMADEMIKQLDIKIPGEITCLESLLQGDDDLIKLAVLDLIEALNKDGYTHLLHIAAQDDRQRVRTRAETILRNTIDLV